MAAPMAVASMGMNAVGGLVQGIGAKTSADAQASASRYKAGVALLNKQINEQNANWAVEAGEAQQVQAGMKARSEIGQTKAVQAASGFDVNSGTNERIREDQTSVAQYDQNVIRWDAAKTAYGYETKATMNQAEANLDQAAASQEEEAGTFAMLGSFINAGSSVAGKWSQGTQSGMF